MEEKYNVDGVTSFTTEVQATPVDDANVTTNETKPKVKEKKKGLPVLIVDIFLFIITLGMFGLSVFTLFLPLGTALFTVFYIFGIFIFDVLLVIGTIFIILLSSWFYEFNTKAFDYANHLNEITGTISQVVSIVLPIFFGIAVVCFITTWIVTIVGMAATKRKAFIPILVILIIITVLFVIVAIISLIANYWPK